MRPKPPAAEPQDDLFRARLQSLVDPRHALVRLAGLIEWEQFEMTFGAVYTDTVGRPGLPTRLMAGLHLLKHMDGLSDEAICARYLDSPRDGAEVRRCRELSGACRPASRSQHPGSPSRLPGGTARGWLARTNELGSWYA